MQQSYAALAQWLQRQKGYKMCNHIWKKINAVRVCVNCGLTILPNGNLYFDRHLPNYLRKGKKNEDVKTKNRS